VEDSVLQVPSALSQLRAVRTYAEKQALHLGFSEQEARDIGLCVHEALTNAIVHGHGLDESKIVHVRFTVTDDHLRIAIRDEGKGYNVSGALHHLRHAESPEQPRGRGLLLMMKLMDDVTFDHGGREIHLYKARPRLPTTDH
jgi:stage II sporulation protein AB (anti-sigma F factor)